MTRLELRSLIKEEMNKMKKRPMREGTGSLPVVTKSSDTDKDKNGKITLTELRTVIKHAIKESKAGKFVCWDAGGGNYEIEKYNPSISWHNDKDVFKGTYDECLDHKERSENDAYRFRNNKPHRSHGYTNDY